jgi:hypothetical protein
MENGSVIYNFEKVPHNGNPSQIDLKSVKRFKKEKNFAKKFSTENNRTEIDKLESHNNLQQKNILVVQVVQNRQTVAFVNLMVIHIDLLQLYK